MSRWLKSVNNLLEQLDGHVGAVVEEGADLRDGGPTSSSVDAILSRRGLDMDDEEEDDDDDDEEEEEEEDDISVSGEDGSFDREEEEEVSGVGLKDDEDEEVEISDVDELVEEEEVSFVSTHEEEDVWKDAAEEMVQEVSSVDKKAVSEERSCEEGRDSTDDANLAKAIEAKEGNEEDVTDATAIENESENEIEIESENQHENESENLEEGLDIAQQEEESVSSSLNTSSKPLAPPIVPRPPSSLSSQAPKEAQLASKRAQLAAKESQKEARKLRRHVVKLNNELESAEHELSAQRSELNRAAERMERDRVKTKEERERMQREHEEAMRAVVEEHEKAVKTMKEAHAEQLEEMRGRLKHAEEARAKEGGDWQGELEEAVQREQDVIRKMLLLEDEKSTLLSQISTLQTQIGSLTSRLDSITQTANNATERETEAEDRLDAALSLHARQLSQRQAREAELERTVADLGAALVVARQREQRPIDAISKYDNEAGTTNQTDHSKDAMLATAQEQLDTAKAQLAFERQRCETLHQELQLLSKETTEQEATTLARQRLHDRRIADLTSTLSKLQHKLRHYEQQKSSTANTTTTTTTTKETSSTSDSSDHLDPQQIRELQHQFKSLSERVIRQQCKIDASASEIKTLQNRLHAALARAEVAERELIVSESATSDVDLESGYKEKRVRRRRGKIAAPSAGSIRSTIGLQQGQGERKEQIGRAIDVLDKWSVETGTYLRYNPLARGAFILYLLVLHLWTLSLLVFHAHTFETEHGDFGLGSKDMLKGEIGEHGVVSGLINHSLRDETQP